MKKYIIKQDSKCLTPCGQSNQSKRVVRFLSSAVLGVAVATGALIAATPAHAQSLYLVGAYLFSSSSNGATVSTGYQYDTNGADAADFLTINGMGTGTGTSKNIAIALTNGTTSLTYASQAGGALTSPDATLGLFFASTATPYNPSTAGSAPTPNLAASSASSSTTFFVPVSGTAFNNYAYQGGSTSNGATSYTLNGSTVSIGSFTTASANNIVSGNFSVVVSSATPEPGSVALLAFGITSGLPVLGMVARRRRKAA